MTALVAVLAGGQGRRMGGAKPVAELSRGRPLIAHPLRAAADAGLEAVVVAKAATPLPPLAVPVWQEPDEPTHPLLGIVTALDRAGRPVVAVGCDMPFVTADRLARLAAGPEAAVYAGGRLEPFPARYEPTALPALRRALAREASMRATLAALEPDTFVVEDRVVASINTPDELANA